MPASTEQPLDPLDENWTQNQVFNLLLSKAKRSKSTSKRSGGVAVKRDCVDALLADDGFRKRLQEWMKSVLHPKPYDSPRIASIPSSDEAKQASMFFKVFLLVAEDRTKATNLLAELRDEYQDDSDEDIPSDTGLADDMTPENPTTTPTDDPSSTDGNPRVSPPHSATLESQSLLGVQSVADRLDQDKLAPTSSLLPQKRLRRSRHASAGDFSPLGLPSSSSESESSHLSTKRRKKLPGLLSETEASSLTMAPSDLDSPPATTPAFEPSTRSHSPSCIMLPPNPDSYSVTDLITSRKRPRRHSSQSPARKVSRVASEQASATTQKPNIETSEWRPSMHQSPCQNHREPAIEASAFYNAESDRSTPETEDETLPADVRDRYTKRFPEDFSGQVHSDKLNEPQEMSRTSVACPVTGTVPNEARTEAEEATLPGPTHSDNRRQSGFIGWAPANSVPQWVDTQRRRLIPPSTLFSPPQSTWEANPSTVVTPELLPGSDVISLQTPIQEPSSNEMKNMRRPDRDPSLPNKGVSGSIKSVTSSSIRNKTELLASTSAGLPPTRRRGRPPKAKAPTAVPDASSQLHGQTEISVSLSWPSPLPGPLHGFGRIDQSGTLIPGLLHRPPQEPTTPSTVNRLPSITGEAPPAQNPVEAQTESCELVTDLVDQQQTTSEPLTSPSTPMAPKPNRPPPRRFVEFGPKPLLRQEPLVWAKTRQALCEGTPYFKSYQGGIHVGDGFAKGYLLDGYGAERDIFAHGGRVIVSHTGGRTQTPNSTEHVALRKVEIPKDQTEQQLGAKALFNNWRLRKPLVLVAGKNYAAFPYDLGEKTYIVLGWYMVTNYWTELEYLENTLEPIKRIKVAFQWLPSQGYPFFIHPDSPMPLPPLSCPPPTVAVPSGPLESSTNSTPPVGGTLSLRRIRFIAQPSCGIKKSVTCTGRDLREPQNAEDASKRETYHCSICKCESEIIYKDLLVCTNGNCCRFWRDATGAYLDVTSLSYSPSFLAPDAILEDIPVPYDIRPSTVPDPTEYDGYPSEKVFLKAMFCDQCGQISSREDIAGWRCSKDACDHVQPVKLESSSLEPPPPRVPLYSKVSSADWLHGRVELVSQPSKTPMKMVTYNIPNALGVIHHIECNTELRSIANDLFREYQEIEHFRRQAIATKKLSTKLLSSQFVTNSGMPYHYVSQGNTLPLDKSPSCVIKALDTLNNVVAGVDDQILQMPFNEALSICYLMGQKLNYHSDDEKGLGEIVASISLGHSAAMEFRPYTNTGHGGRCLRLELRHGDIVVMRGRSIQEAFQVGCSGTERQLRTNSPSKYSTELFLRDSASASQQDRYTPIT